MLVDNLMNPAYALDDPTSSAPRVGTLMRIQSAERTEDSRLALVVQGLVRVRIVEQTQKEPFTRATVQLLPDDEITASYYKSAARLMTGTNTRTAAASPEQPPGSSASSFSSASVSSRADGGSWVHTLAHAAAVVRSLLECK